MTSLTVLRPDLIVKIFHPESRKTNPKGYYRLRFYLNGIRQEISIDDTFLCNASVLFYSKVEWTNIL